MKTIPKQNKQKKMSPFDFLNIFFEKKPIPPVEDIDKYCDQYILNMTLSCDQQLTGIAHLMTTLRISNRMYFDCLYYGLPKGKRYIKYTAKKAKKDKEVQYLMEYYNCSQQVAKEYHALIDETEMKEIKDHFEKRGVS